MLITRFGSSTYNAQQPFWHWPGWRQLGYSVLLSLLVILWFLVIYGGTDYLTSLHNYRVRVHFDAELHIPFVPQAVIGYLSIFGLLCAPAFILRARQELQAFASTLARGVTSRPQVGFGAWVSWAKQKSASLSCWWV